MKLKKFAAMLNGRKYGYPQFTKKELMIARKNGFVNQCKKIFYPRRLRSRLGGEIALRILFFVGKI